MKKSAINDIDTQHNGTKTISKKYISDEGSEVELTDFLKEIEFYINGLNNKNQIAKGVEMFKHKTVI